MPLPLNKKIICRLFGHKFWEREWVVCSYSATFENVWQIESFKAKHNKKIPITFCIRCGIKNKNYGTTPPLF